MRSQLCDNMLSNKNKNVNKALKIIKKRGKNLQGQL